MKLGPFDSLPLEWDVPLHSLHTFGTDTYTRCMMRIWDEASLHLWVSANSHLQWPTMVLSGGSNVLFQQDFNGVILKNEILGREIISTSSDHVLLKLGAGENWHDVVLFSLEQGWGGIENLSLIPGSVGAAPIQNIGAYGVELKDVFEYLEAIHLETGETHTFNQKSCRFGYRDSIFKQEAKTRYMITRVVIRLTQSDHQIRTNYGAIKEELKIQGITEPGPQDISRVVCKIRQSKLPDPSKLGNAGSFFKNPLVSQTQFEELKQLYPQIPHYEDASGLVKIPAAWLIQQCGWKGKRFGKHGVYEKQALVLVNYGGAKGEDIFKLSEDIQQSVWSKFEIPLEREVQII